MRRLLIFLLGIFLIVDLVLALLFFNPKLLKLPFNRRSISIESSIPHTQAQLANKQFIDKKLDEIGFWKEKGVNQYSKNGIEKITVEHVRFDLTDKPQLWGIRSDDETGVNPLYSYGQVYDGGSSTMKILIHVNPTYRQKSPLDQRYSSATLYAIFDLTQPFPRKSYSTYDRQLVNFMNDYYQNELANNFINLNQQ